MTLRRSPFPGMDPHLESPVLWPGFHDSLITYLKDELQPRLPERYYADLQDRVYLADAARWVIPDVRISQADDLTPAHGGRVPLAEGASPALLVAADIDVREPYVEIRDRRTGDRVVTVIEVLSPQNKRPEAEARHLDRSKQRELLREAVSLVEIDLLRGGAHTVTAPAAEVPAGTAYRVAVRRARDPRRVELYPVTLREALPRVAVPLTDPDPDIVVDLQALVDRAYAGGAYWKRVDYRAAPDPALEAADATWARELAD